MNIDMKNKEVKCNCAVCGVEIVRVVNANCCVVALCDEHLEGLYKQEEENAKNYQDNEYACFFDE